ncbi:Serine/threonine protein kinase [Plantibacter flavus]|uniref:non-specific serine/threonine protein kinase n=1 Tax=Plantibacter flavus TaxID=150123 RepID=A0A3N2C3Z9_9MICO|nr:serine/threonine-protein kinase [Plantibacter flavus]ROR82232.1 serine/threonine protein kinase [Plantibacter flavus]SMG42575.1 Serine/threonine protein kinase [Plantibacter flavus]
MVRRLPTSPPRIAGCTALHPLGSGGFADVFLYRQSMPQRDVAVKVLLPDLTEVDVREQFLAETAIMAELSAHPSVLTVYEAGIADDGRPYLMMERCRPDLAERFRTAAIPVEEVLAVAVAIGGALETAHRAGVLHRDVKPSNILTTRYGRPVLADFGIATTMLAVDHGDRIAHSVPWAAPEVLAGTTSGTVRTEVWSFAATLYTLLSGRTPFESPGSDNGRAALADRITGRGRPTPIGRPDLPQDVEAVILRGLAKRPEARPSSVVELVRGLQLAEQRLGLRPTPLDVEERRIVVQPTSVVERAGSSQHGATRRRRTAGTTGGTSSSGRSGSGASSRAEGSFDATVRRDVGQVRHAGASARVRLTLIGAVVVGALVVSGAAAALWSTSAAVPTVQEVRSEPSGGRVVFSWDASGDERDRYLVEVDGAAGAPQRARSVAVDATGGRVCVTVTVVRDGTSGEPSEPACAG